MYKGLYRKRQLAYGGLLKQIKKELELDDIENGDLIHVDEETGEISEGTKIIAAWDWQRKIILLNKKEKWIPIHYACKRSKNYIYLFFCYRAKRHYTDRKVTLFCGFFFLSMYIYTLACQFIKKDWQATGLCTQTPKSAFSTFLFRVPKTLYI